LQEEEDDDEEDPWDDGMHLKQQPAFSFSCMLLVRLSRTDKNFVIGALGFSENFPPKAFPHNLTRFESSGFLG